MTYKMWVSLWVPQKDSDSKHLPVCQKQFSSFHNKLVSGLITDLAWGLQIHAFCAFEFRTPPLHFAYSLGLQQILCVDGALMNASESPTWMWGVWQWHVTQACHIANLSPMMVMIVMSLHSGSKQIWIGSARVAYSDVKWNEGVWALL